MQLKQITKARLADGLIEVIALGSVTAVGLLAPNALQALNKPLKKFLDTLEKRERERQIGEALSYLRYRKLIIEDYQHGLRLAEKAVRRLDKREIDNLSVTRPAKWDDTWRIVFFDIPEDMKYGRDRFSAYLKTLGFGVLQRSVFICPYPCREEVALLARYFKVANFVTYIETSHIDNESPLKEHFNL